MSDKSDIEWTDATWNPVRGCIKVSPGCKYCYAETFAERFRGVPGHPYEHGFDPRIVPEMLGRPIRWTKPRRIFVNSMSDLFQEAVSARYVASVFGVMSLACHHTFQVLTKRADRMASLISVLTLDVCHGALLMDYPEVGPIRAQSKAIRDALPKGSPFASGSEDPLWPLPNVHLGVSVEDRKFGVPRIDHLRDTPAVVRFLSIEPLLEDVGKLDLRGIHQVIAGAESGPGARPMHEDWVRSIRDQAKASGCAFFYKQKLNERGKKVSLPMLDGERWAETPTVATSRD
jgi:protein gp37